jgi:hypothetical protein
MNIDILEVVNRIKSKKELSGVSDSIILEHLEEYLRKNKLSLERLNNSQIKLVIKDIRSDLRNHVGRFLASTKNRGKLLEKEDIPSLLKTHSSTKERIEFYPQLKEIISRLNTKSILDLGCGINPIALASSGVKYYASDINTADLNAVEAFFEKNKIDGKTFVCDLNKIEGCKLPEADLCLILKVFDILGKKDYEIAEKVLESINCKHIIASFSTRTLSGKPMNSPRRIWFEKLLNSLCYQFEIIKSKNEIFYIV